MSWVKTRFFGYGILFATAGIKVLTSKDAKKVYTYCTAAVLRGADEVTKAYTILKENCKDIYDDAKELNTQKMEEAEKQIIEDSAKKA